jgi:hypothetical protein
MSHNNVVCHNNNQQLNTILQHNKQPSTYTRVSFRRKKNKDEVATKKDVAEGKRSTPKEEKVRPCRLLSVSYVVAVGMGGHVIELMFYVHLFVILLCFSYIQRTLLRCVSFFILLLFSLV